MKSIRWTRQAALDLERIWGHISQFNPQRSRETVETVLAAIATLENFPGRGRLGRVEFTRELVLAPLPYLVIYEIGDEVVKIIRILHGAQKWP